MIASREIRESLVYETRVHRVGDENKSIVSIDYPLEMRQKNPGSFESAKKFNNTNKMHEVREAAKTNLAMLFNLLILIITSQILSILAPSALAESSNGNQLSVNETKELPMAQPLTLHQAGNGSSDSDSVSRALVGAASTTTFSLDAAANEPSLAYNHQHYSNSNQSPQQGSVDTKKDRLAQSSASNSQYQQHNHYNHQHHHPNHQDYPLEPYPSASYSSLVTVAPPSSYLLHRDRHQTTNGASNHQPHDYSEGFNSTVMKFNNSFGNQSPLSNLAGGGSESAASEANNHVSNYGSSSSSSLNTGLIQNLTASLFPVNQLSNATLLTLSELLNKTRQVGSQLNQQFSNGYKPAAGLNELGYPASNYFTSNQQQPQQSLSLNDQQYGLFDYNHFGFRETASPYHQPSSGSSYFRSAGSQHKPMNSLASNLNYNDNSANSNNNLRGSGYKTSSNIYNTYLPYKDNLNSMPTMTNGQSLSMALYDNYLDNGGYKMPLLSNGLSKGTSNPGFATNGYTSNNSPSYQYVQQHNINNQNHLDKIVYHSTPFRPSIVSPPPMSSPTPTPGLMSSTSMVPPMQSVTDSSSSGGLNQVRLIKSDEKPMPFASLSSSSSAISDASKAEYNSNDQSNKQSNRYPSSSASSMSKDQMGRFTTEASKSTTSSTTTSTPPSATNTEPFEPERRQNASAKPSDSSISKTTGALQQFDLKEVPGNPPLSTGQAILFDLYEREIDDQIREALYGSGSGATVKGNQPDAIMNSFREQQRPLQTMGGYDPSGAEQHNLAANWDQPVALGSHESYAPSFNPSRPRPILGGQPTSLDPLSAALQELPTFSASDLQPIFPTMPAYSLLPPAPASSAYETFGADAPLTALTSQLYPIHHAGGGSTTHVFGHENGYMTASQPYSPYSSSSSSSSGSGQQSSSSALSLPALLFKLHSSPLSSILASPLTHLYASLPRNRNKKPSSGQQSKKPVTAASNNSYRYSLSPSSLFANHPPNRPSGGKQLFKVLGGASYSDLMALSSGEQKSISIAQQQQQQQQEAATLAAATASILASELPLTPLQAALLQTQAANMYLGANTADTDLLHGSSLASDQAGGLRASNPTESSGSHATGGFGLTGGGISPLIWRGIFSPNYWAQKQSTTSSGQTTNIRGGRNQQTAATAAIKSIAAAPLSFNPFSSLAHNQGSHNQKSAASNDQPTGAGSGKSQLQSQFHLPLSSLLRGSLASQYLSNQLASASSNSVSQHQQPQQQQSSQQVGSPAKTTLVQKKPRLKIKILKIPIAFYDQPTSIGGQTAGSTPVLSHSVLSSASTDGASFLAGLPCPLSHTGYQPAHTLEQHLLGQQQILSSPSGGLTAHQPPAPLMSPFQFSGAHLVQHTSAAPANASVENPSISIQGFTDINQPNDLQVSPTTNSNQGKLYKTAL